jgi:hypothetical protein
MGVLPQIPKDVEIGSSGFDHKEIGTFFLIQKGIPQNCASAGRVRLIAALI